MVELINHLNAIHPLSPEAVVALLKAGRPKELRRGQVWLQEGAVCDKITFVVKGLLKLYFEVGSKEVILDFARENEWMVSAQSYFGQTPSAYAIRAIEPSIVLSITKHDLEFLVERSPELSRHFNLIGSSQIRLLEQHTGLLLLPPKERFEKMLESGSWIIDGRRIKDKLLAGYLGVRANTICEWRKDKQVFIKRK